MFFSHPQLYSCNQQPPVCEVKRAVMYEPSLRRRRGKPSREERERRRLQKAKDHEAASAATKAADQLQKEKTARVAEQNAAHRQVQISRSAAEKKERIAKMNEAHQIAQMSRSAVEKEVKAALGCCG